VHSESSVESATSNEAVVFVFWSGRIRNPQIQNIEFETSRRAPSKGLWKINVLDCVDGMTIVYRMPDYLCEPIWCGFDERVLLTLLRATAIATAFPACLWHLIFAKITSHWITSHYWIVDVWREVRDHMEYILAHHLRRQLVCTIWRYSPKRRGRRWARKSVAIEHLLLAS